MCADDTRIAYIVLPPCFCGQDVYYLHRVHILCRPTKEFFFFNGVFRAYHATTGDNIADRFTYITVKYV